MCVGILNVLKTSRSEKDPRHAGVFFCLTCLPEICYSQGVKVTGLLLLFGLGVLGFFAQPSFAQLNCPTACQASSAFCAARGSTATSCPAQWRGLRCANMPCAYRQACGCGACLSGCNVSACSACKGVPGTGGQSPAPQSPDSSTPGGSNSPAPDGTTPRTPLSTAPLTPECKTRCDRNNDGVITKSDFSDLIGYAQTPETQELLTFCTQSCPLTDGSGGNPGGATPQPTRPARPTGSQDETIRKGDCSGRTPGEPDGAVDIFDIEQFRQEFNQESKTLFCDLDKRGVVDIIDFSNFIRPAFASQLEDPIPPISAFPTVEPLPSSIPVPTITPSVPASATTAPATPTSSVLRP